MFTRSFLVGLLLACSSAQAAVVAYRVQLTGAGTSSVAGDVNLPYIGVTNTSTSHRITEVRVTVGDTRYNFDNALYEGTAAGTKSIREAWSSVSATSFVQYGPDNSGTGGLRSDTVRFTFPSTNATSQLLLPGRSFRWRSDVDPDLNPESYVALDYRQILFDLNGTSSSDNALVTVLFSNGRTLSQRLPDFKLSSNGIYTMSQSYTLPVTASLTADGDAAKFALSSASVTAVPEPSPGMVGCVIAALSVLRRRRPLVGSPTSLSLHS